VKTIRTVFLKEFIDNVRDRRTLISALLMGPVFGPVLFAVIIAYFVIGNRFGGTVFQRLLRSRG